MLMKPPSRRLLRWPLLFLSIALFAFFVWTLSADKRGRWLSEAAWSDETTKTKILILLGTDINSPPHGCESALHGAAYRGNIELMRFLLRRGAIVDQEAKFGVTPLWLARQNHQFAAEQLLLAHGANPDTSHIHPP